jgi:hypothetical protein
MARKVEDIELDIVEANELLLSSKRITNQTVLTKHLSALKVEL